MTFAQMTLAEVARTDNSQLIGRRRNIYISIMWPIMKNYLWNSTFFAQVY